MDSQSQTDVCQFNTLYMAFLLGIILVLLLEIQGTSCLWTVSKITAKTGGFVTIPCHYHLLHKEHPKYWCKGRNWSTCMTLRPTNQKEKRPGISFYNNPDELVITMTMTNLRSSDSNRYWCAVKIGGLLRSDIKTSLELTVTEGIPDLSVASMVSSEEGGNTMVECMYSEKLKDSEKKWCRSGDLHSCQTPQNLKSSPDAAVQINDTNDGVFRVTLTGLKKNDAGWYWCMAGGLQAPVHINVTSVQPTATNTGPSASSTMTPWSSYSPTNTFAVNPLTNSSFSTVNSYNSGATSKLPDSTSDENEKISTASPKQLPTTIDSSTYPTTRNKYSSHFSGVTTTVGSSYSSVTVSSKDYKSPFECRALVCVIMLVCGALLLLFILSGIWTLWSWHRKANTGDDATEITTELLYMKANERDDL